MNRMDKQTNKGKWLVIAEVECTNLQHFKLTFGIYRTGNNLCVKYMYVLMWSQLGLEQLLANWLISS